MDVFELVGKIFLHNSDANEALKETSAEGQKAESKLGKAFSAMGKGAAVAGKAIGAGLVAGGAAMAGLTVKALNMSGELEQNMGGSEAVFEGYAWTMQQTAKEAFANMGLSTNEFLATANKMGALFQGAGFSIGESSELASDAMQRAADVASIMGIDTATAMESIAGAAKGNFDMMDNLGVAMNDTTLQAYALEKGIEKSTQEMTNQEKIGLAMEMFMEKTAYAAGNYAKENETLAGSLGTAKSALTNFLDGSGDVDSLVTAFDNAANVIVKNVSDLAPRLVGGLTEVVNKIIPILPPLLNTLLPVIVDGAISLVNGLVAALPAVIDALMASLPALIAGVISIVNALIAALPQILGALVAALPELLPLLINGLVSMIVSLCTMLTEIIQPIIDNLPMIITSIVTALVENLPILVEGLIMLIMALVEALPDIIIPMQQAMPAMIQQVVGVVISTVLGMIPDLLMAGWQLLQGLVMGIIGGVAMIPDALAALWNGIVGGFKALFGIHSPSTVMMELGTFLMQGLINGIKSLISKIGDSWTSIKNKFSEGKTAIVSMFSNIKEKLSEPFEKARDTIEGIAEKIKGFFKGEISMPKIKTPKFAVTPEGWKIGDLLDGVIPKLGITWHAKGAIMKEPTLFGYNPATATAHVGGEAGDEAIAPIDTLQQYVRSAVQMENNALVQKLDRIITMMAQFFPDMLAAMDFDMYLDGDTLVGGTAVRMDTALGKIAIKQRRGR